VAAYQRSAAAQQDIDRQDEGRAKTGVFTGSYAVNPVNGAPIPVWIADYVLMGYGTGAIMAVPCGDHRDFEFARQFGLHIPPIQQPPQEWFDRHGIAPTLDTSAWPEAFVGDAPYVNSANDGVVLDGLTSVPEATERINAWLEAHGHGAATVNYRLRDWLFSRQRYWGEPFPIVYDRHDLPVALSKEHLPVVLPDLEDFKPDALDPNPAPGPRRPLAEGGTRPGRRSPGVPPRDQRDAPVGGQLLVRVALPGPHQRNPLRGPRGRALLARPSA
jgi:leucyl-tRNA synthetase